ncbi:MAG: LysM domain-containing protein, partial [Chloroflexota bacterium]
FLALLFLITTLLLAAPSLTDNLQAQNDDIPETYTVQAGDTLSGIVWRFFRLRGVANINKAEELAILNGLSSINSIWEGQVLKLKGAAAPPTSETPMVAPAAPESLSIESNVTTLQVVAANNDEPISDALVYRLVAGQLSDGQKITDLAEKTDANGRLETAQTFANGDQLLALAPVTENSAFRLFYMSGQPTQTGIETAVVENETLPTLKASPEHPLILFDFEISLEWNPTSNYMERLKSDLIRSSEILFDISNGQAALGNITIYTNKEQWTNADIVIFADNTFRPNATLGGIVNSPFTHAFDEQREMRVESGQIRMAAIWNRFGEPNRREGEDWPRTLAHEISHYAFFVPDNYIGIDDNGLLIHTDCRGSVLTDAYREDYSEWLTQTQWENDAECQKTLTAKATGLSDWQVVREFYPFLDDNTGEPLIDDDDSTIDNGPLLLPFAFTQISEQFQHGDLADEQWIGRLYARGRRVSLDSGEAEIYLFKTQGTAADLTDDDMIRLGTTNGRSFPIRGGEAGDRICIFNTHHTPLRMRCRAIKHPTTAFLLTETENWQPNIEISPNDAGTHLIVNVSGATSAVMEETLQVQLFPGVRPASGEMAPVVTLEAGETNGTYTAEIPVPGQEQLLYGYVRVWGIKSNTVKTTIEAIELFANFDEPVSVAELESNSIRTADTTESTSAPTDLPNWLLNLTGTKNVVTANIWKGLGPNMTSRGGVNIVQQFFAPLNSPDSQLMVFNSNKPLDGIGRATLQTVSVPPDLPAWLTLVGDVYRFRKQEATPDQFVIQLRYNEQELPQNDELLLRLYYRAADKAEWEPLLTNIDPIQNTISAKMIPNDNNVYDGYYALMVTVPPAIIYGWLEPIPNEFEPEAGMSITAHFDGQACGSGIIGDGLNPDGNQDSAEFAFVLILDPAECGLQSDDVITINVDGQEMKRTNSLDIRWQDGETQLMTLTLK